MSSNFLIPIIIIAIFGVFYVFGSFFSKKKKPIQQVNSSQKEKLQKLLDYIKAKWITITIILIVIIFLLIWRPWKYIGGGSSDPIKNPFSFTGNTPVNTPPNSLTKDKPTVMTKGVEYTFHKDEDSTFFRPVNPGKIHLYCWNDRCSWEMAVIRTTDGKVHGEVYNSSPERRKGIYSVRLMDNNPGEEDPNSVEIIFSETSEQ